MSDTLEQLQTQRKMRDQVPATGTEGHGVRWFYHTTYIMTAGPAAKRRESDEGTDQKGWWGKAACRGHVTFSKDPKE